MIFHKRLKLGIFQVPKTGSSTITKLFKSYNINHINVSHTHSNWPHLLKRYKPMYEDLENYRFFAFYREPISRFQSAVNYTKRTVYRDTLQYFYDDPNFSCARVDPYDTLEPELKEKIERIHPLDLLRHPLIGKSLTFEKQVHWLDHPIDITYLNYHDYENEVKRLLNEFQLPTVDIPRHNQSISVPDADILSDRDIAYLKEYYREDYDFFASKGITFSS